MDEKKKLSPISRRAFFKQVGAAGLGVAAGASLIGAGCSESLVLSARYCNGCCRNYVAYSSGTYCNYSDYTDACC